MTPQTEHSTVDTPTPCPTCRETGQHANSCPFAPCPYFGCDGTADGSSCRHPEPGEDYPTDWSRPTYRIVCEGYNVAGRWVDCDRPMPHVHGIVDDMVQSPFTRRAIAGRLPAKIVR